MSSQDKQTLAFLEAIRRRCPDHLPVLEALGDLYTKSGLYQEGLAMDLILVDRDPENATYWYNLACSYCRLDQFDACLQALKKGIEKGYDDFVWMLKDDDLAGIRHHPEFKQIVSELKNR